MALWKMDINYNVSFAKISGKYQFDIGRNVESDTYNPNDMGFFTKSKNEITHFASAGYNPISALLLY